MTVFPKYIILGWGGGREKNHIFSVFTLISTRCNGCPLASCPRVRRPLHSLGWTICLAQDRRNLSPSLHRKMKCNAVLWITYIFDHRYTDWLLLSQGSLIFFKLDYFWLSTIYLGGKKGHVPFVGLAEVDILYLLEKAVLGTSGSDETWARSWPSATKATASMDITNVKFFPWTPT